MAKVLFIIKKRQIYSEKTYSVVNSGLYNSAMFVNNMLISNCIDSKLVQVVDNNGIDKVCKENKPDVVIIEALWVVPSKFEVLQKLHPNITWVIRLHSELPFIANEGVAIEWLKDYSKYKKVQIAANSKVFIDSMEPILNREIIYMPNYYPTCGFKKSCNIIGDTVNVGLFGAIRPLKNCLTQAIAAIIFAERSGKILNLHVNVARIEQKGEATIKNIRALFEDSKHKLIEHGWLKHSDFLEVVSEMHIGLQVSLSETYNIVAADLVSRGIPVITSKEIPFVSCLNKVQSTKDAIEIADMMEVAMLTKPLSTRVNKFLLWLDSFKSKRIWIKLFK